MLAGPAISLRSRLRRALGPALGIALFFSIASSILMLGVPLYSLQLFDRVLPTGHAATLLLLSLALVLVVLTWGVLEALRNTLLARVGTKLVDRLGDEIVTAAAERNLPAGRALRELDLVRQIVGGPAMQAFFELPWLPLGLAAVAVLHPALGIFALASACLLLFLGWLNDRLTRRRTRSAHELSMEAHQRGEAISRWNDVVQAMGMLPALRERFQGAHRPALLLQQRANERGSWLGGLVRACRLLVQAGVMGLGAWLVVRRELTPGALIAGSILTSRALAPVEQLLGSWRALTQARESLARLAGMLDGAAPAEAMPLPPPQGRVAVEALAVITPEGRALLHQASFRLEAGTVLGIVGPSGAGKTTLCRALAGCLRASRGIVRLDGADLAQLAPEARGPYVGYLPQDAALFAGSVSANIARMAVEPDPERVVEAARRADVHEMVLRLPQGYDTPLQDGGLPLSGGQRQRIGLARALYGNPRLLILDEPNAHLDGPGEAALIETLRALKAEGTTIVIVTHRPNMLVLADLVMLLENGTIGRFGPRDEVMTTLMRPARVA